MNLWKTIRDRFTGKGPKFARPPSKWKNKAGGLAWIRIPQAQPDGSEALDRRVVKTVRTDDAGFWVIEPQQEFRLKCWALQASGGLAWPGEIATVESMHDDLLEPIPPVGDEEQDESAAWLPPVPSGITQEQLEKVMANALDHYIREKR